MFSTEPQRARFSMAESSTYKQKLDDYIALVSDNKKSISYSRLEHHFECLRDWNIHHTLEEVKEWFNYSRKNCLMQVHEIPLNSCKGWSSDKESGNYGHSSGDFFSVHGVRVDADSREVGKGGWDQPILTQIGFDGGLLGILRQRFGDIPHYLIEAKAEPGNYQRVQLSPTLQATFSNLKRAHEGRKPLFSEFFENPLKNSGEVLFDQWLSEDGGRFYLKRNRGMLVEVPERTIVEIPAGFIWLSMWQIKELLLENAWVNPHIRGIISHM